MPEKCDWQLEKARDKARCQRAEQTTDEHDCQLEQHRVQEEAARQRETPMGN